MSGETIFKTFLMPDIQVMMEACSNLASTKKDYVWDMKNSNFASLYAKTISLIKSGSAARATGKRSKEPVHQVVREHEETNSQLKEAVAAGKAVLAKSMQFEYDEVDHYRFHDDGTFIPVHSLVRGHSYVRMYRGDWIAMLKLEAGRDGGLKIPCLYMDVPWGVHPRRKEDAVRTSPDEVSVVLFFC